MSNTGQAWVTLATNDSYSLGALVLAQSLKRNNTIHQLAILITPGVSPAMREVLSSVFDLVKEVDVLDSRDAANLALLARPDLGITFTKLHCWNLTQYSKCVFLDADTLIIKNCDELFERDELSAAPDAGWPDCFNSGVFVFTPSENTFKSLLEFALTNGSFDGGDQGLLNMYFGDWATKDITKHLPFIYNMVATATYSYLPAFKAYGGNVKIAHFIGSSKPWLQALPGGTTLSSFLDLWWDIFLKDISTKLNTNMIINCTVFEEGPQASKFSTPHPPPLPVQRHVFVDPWDCIQQKQPEKQTDSTHLNTQDVIDIMVEHLKQTHHHYQADSSTAHHHRHISNPHKQPTYVKQYSAPNISHNEEHFIQQTSQAHSNILNQQKKTLSLQHLQQRPLQNHYGQLYTQKEVIREEPLRRAESYENIPSTISPPSTPSCVEQTSFLTKTEEPTAVSEEGGLAGALAGGQKDVIEDTWRKQSWEQGNIDYMGRDAFENILKKISETVGEEIKPLDTPAPEVPGAQIELALAPEPEAPKTEDKTDSSKVEDQLAGGQPVETPQPIVEQSQPDVPKAEVAVAAEPVPSEPLPTEPVSPPKSVAPVEAPAAEAKKEEASKAESSQPSAPPAVAPLAPQVPDAKPEDTSEAPSPAAIASVEIPVTLSEPEPPVPAEVIPTAESTSVPIQAEAPAATTGNTVSSAVPTETAVTDPAPVAAAPQPLSPPTPVDSSPPQSQQQEQPKDSTPAAPPASEELIPTPPKDDSKPPEPPKGGEAETVAAAAQEPAAPAQEPAAPTSPFVPSPASPSAPEGTKVDTPEPLSPDPLTLPAAETSTPPQTPVGDAPVPPKRSSKKGKSKK